jgi:hypothetical protein
LPSSFLLSIILLCSIVSAPFSSSQKSSSKSSFSIFIFHLFPFLGITSNVFIQLSLVLATNHFSFHQIALRSFPNVGFQVSFVNGYITVFHMFFSIENGVLIAEYVASKAVITAFVGIAVAK